MKAKFPHETIMFDLGETLFEPLARENGRRNLEIALSELGLPTLSEGVYNTHAQVRKQVAITFQSKPFFLHREFVAQAFRLTCEALKLDYTGKDVSSYCESQRISVTQNLRPREDCLTTLGALRNQNKVIAIVSNIDDDWLEPLTERYSLKDYVDLILSSETATSCKPHAGIFLEACRLLKTQPEQVLFVGDDEVNDIQGANRIGMTTVLFDENQDSEGTEANATITSLKQLVD